MQAGVKTNSNILSSALMFSCLALGGYIPVFDKFGPDNQNSLFKMKFAI